MATSTSAPAPVMPPATVPVGPILSMFDPMFIGIDEYGHHVNLDVVFHNLLTAGEPGGGKSGLVNNIARATTKMSRWDGIFDAAIVDGLVNLTGEIIYACGSWLRRFQTGYIRSYVLFLVLAAVAIFFALSYFLNLGTAGP